MFHKTTLWQHLGQKIGISLSTGAAIWIVLLVNGSVAIRNSTEASYSITFGPLLLSALSKQKIDGGVKAAISFEPNIVCYLIFWAVIGVVIGLIADRLNPKKT